jgi:hypothetical protein
MIPVDEFRYIPCGTSPEIIEYEIPVPVAKTTVDVLLS